MPAYTCDAEGLLTSYNAPAGRLWGQTPTLGDPGQRWCGSFRLALADGSQLSHARCWAALVARSGRPYNGRGVVVERPDGSSVDGLAYANPLERGADGRGGVVNAVVGFAKPVDREAGPPGSSRAASAARRQFREGLTQALYRGSPGAGETERVLAPLIALCRIGVASSIVPPIVDAPRVLDEAAAFIEAIRFARAVIAAALPAVDLAPREGPPATDGIRVLLVDDNAALRRRIGDILDGQSDIQVVAEADNGADGVRLAREFWPDVVLMDVSMPGMDGVAATRAIVTSLRRIAVVACSLNDVSRTRARMLQAGAVGYVAKTDVHEQLVGAIRAAAESLA